MKKNLERIAFALTQVKDAMADQKFTTGDGWICLNCIRRLNFE